MKNERQGRQKNIYLFVDGSNLYAGQYELFGPKKYLDFGKLIDQVEEKLKIEFTKIYFYASYSPKPRIVSAKVKDYLKNEAMFYCTKRRPRPLGRG